jgi:DNA-binding ferritin-like protein (Dps family)
MLVLDSMMTRTWLEHDSPVRVRNYWKYHRTEERKPRPPDQTRPNLTDKDKNKKAQAPLFVLPDWIDLALWSDYKQMRVRIRKPMTHKAELLAVQHLENLRSAGNDTTKVIEQSILNSWQGLFEVKQANGNGKAETAGDRLQARIERLTGGKGL